MLRESEALTAALVSNMVTIIHVNLTGLHLIERHEGCTRRCRPGSKEDSLYIVAFQCVAWTQGTCDRLKTMGEVRRNTALTL